MLNLKLISSLGVASLALAPAVLLSATPTTTDDGDELQLAYSRVYWEYNDSANDLGVHVTLDGEDWKSLKLEDPNERVIWGVRGKAGYAKLGMTELFFEGEGMLSHAIPDGPDVFANLGDNDLLEISWTHVTSPPPGFPDLPVNVVAYQVIVEPAFQLTVPSSVLSVTISPEYVATLEPGENLFEVLAIGEGDGDPKRTAPSCPELRGRRIGGELHAGVYRELPSARFTEAEDRVGAGLEPLEREATVESEGGHRRDADPPQRIEALSGNGAELHPRHRSFRGTDETRENVSVAEREDQGFAILARLGLHGRAPAVLAVRDEGIPTRRDVLETKEAVGVAGDRPAPGHELGRERIPGDLRLPKRVHGGVRHRLAATAADDSPAQDAGREVDIVGQLLDPPRHGEGGEPGSAAVQHEVASGLEEDLVSPLGVREVPLLLVVAEARARRMEGERVVRDGTPSSPHATVHASGAGEGRQDVVLRESREG